jgi:hypothetical protein
MEIVCPNCGILGCGECPKCGGSGEDPSFHAAVMHMGDDESEPCPECDGSGICSTCDGTGFVEEDDDNDDDGWF